MIIQMFWIHSLCSMLLRHNRRMGRCPVLELTVINVLGCRLVTLCANSSVAFVADDVQIKATRDSVVRDKHNDGAPSSVGGAVFLLLSHCYYSLIRISLQVSNWSLMLIYTCQRSKRCSILICRLPSDQHMLAQARVHVAFVLTNQNLVLVRPLCKLETQWSTCDQANTQLS